MSNFSAMLNLIFVSLIDNPEVNYEIIQGFSTAYTNKLITDFILSN